LGDLHHSGRGFSTNVGSVFWIAGLEWFVAQGVAQAALLAHHWPRNKATMLGLFLLVLFGVGKVIVGLAPEDQRLFLHAIGSLGILFGNVGCLVFGAGLWRMARPLSLIFLCVGAVGVVGFISLLFPR
jgi:hypothetical protein